MTIDTVSTSVHPLVLTLVLVPVTAVLLLLVLPTTLESAVRPVSTLFTIGFLTESVCWTLFTCCPEVRYSASAAQSPGSSIISLVSLEVTLIVLIPVLNLGLVAIVGSGICNENINTPNSSLISETSFTVASAVPSALARRIPSTTHPSLSEFLKSAKSKVSTLIVSLVAEYDEVKVFWL